MGDRKDYMNEAFDAGLITLGAGDNLGVPSSPKGILKLAVALGVGAVGVHYLQFKKLVPDDPFK
jgi:hypothetical protein